MSLSEGLKELEREADSLFRLVSKLVKLYPRFLVCFHELVLSVGLINFKSHEMQAAEVI
jgi:hypothetical protein